MNQARGRIEAKSAERLAFAHYLRTGQSLPDSTFESNRLIINSKFNQNHDPSNGQFTFGPGGSASPGRSGGANIRTTASRSQGSGSARPKEEVQSRNSLTGTGTVRKRLVVAKPGHQPIFAVTDIGARSAKYETGHTKNPGAIVYNKKDPGSPSYGTFQLSSKRGTLGEFMASPEARKYTAELKGLIPSTPSFDNKWREIARREPDAFDYAQGAFVARTHFDRPVSRIKTETGYDLNSASDSVVQTVYSTTVQHGPSGGGGMIIDAIKKTQQKFKRHDPGYDAALINNIYDVRTARFPSYKGRYVQERLDALLGLARDKRR